MCLRQWGGTERKAALLLEGWRRVQEREWAIHGWTDRQTGRERWMLGWSRKMTHRTEGTELPQVMPSGPWGSQSPDFGI